MTSVAVWCFLSMWRRRHGNMSTYRSPLRWYAISAVAVSMALLFNLALAPWIRPNVFPPFLIAVLLCSRYGGMGPGLTATALSLAACCVLLGRSARRDLPGIELPHPAI